MFSPCLVALATITTNPEQAGSPFCRDYRAVLAQAYRGFRQYHGTIEDWEDLGFSKTYHATFSLPGGRCTITDTEYDYTYACSWKQNADDWQGAMAEARTLAQSLAACSEVRLIEFGESNEENGNLRWRARLNLNSAERTSVEVNASNFASHMRRSPPRLSAIHMRIKYEKNRR
jgi:hypothetical protein